MARNYEAPVQPRGGKIAKKSAKGKMYVDYKDVDELRRLLSPNGKMYSRKRIGVNAREQRMIAQAIKRARYLGLLPYTDATL
ncbi:MAG: 30S ribosomal protein S18 [Phycisphaerales bacterium]|nr:30S ribosomal protein S18 [Phycisphaerales bacterium]